MAKEGEPVSRALFTDSASTPYAHEAVDDRLETRQPYDNIVSRLQAGELAF